MDATQTRALADLLDRTAEHLRDALTSVAAAVDPVWRGARATTFRHELDDWGARVGAPWFGTADQLADVARQLRDRATLADWLVAVDAGP